MYNPDGKDDKHEWLEIKNSGTSEVVIIIGAGADSWRFFDGSNHYLYHDLDASYILGAGAYAILADDPATFLSDYPDFSGAIFKVSMSLKNSGDIIKLSNNEGSTWFSETQYISLFGANGNGKSLEYTNQGWRESFVDGGTPGKESSTMADLPKPKEYSNKVYISKIYPHPKTGESEKEFIELYNDSPNDIDLAGWKLDDEPNAGSSEYTISSDRNGGSVIKTSGSLAFERSETGLALNDSSGDLARLLDPNGREISQTPNYGKAKSEKKFYRDAKGVWRWEEDEIVGVVITPLQSPMATFAGQATTTITTTEIITTAPPAVEGKIKGIETIKPAGKIQKIARYVLDASAILLILLIGDYLWKLEQKAQKKPKN